MIRRTVEEWKSIAHGEGEERIPEWAADRIAAVAKASPLTGILEHRRHDLRAGQVVGVIAAGGCALEILPKIDGLDSDGAVRRRLVDMLAVALDLDIAAGQMTDLGWQRDNLLEILIGLFSRKLLDTVRHGMPRRYIACADDLPALRGRLDVIRQFTTLAASAQRLACRYDALSPDIALNRIMKAAVSRLARLSRSPDNQRRVAELSFVYADIAGVPVKALRWDDVVLDRTNAAWRELLALARLLLGERFQTTSSGEARGFSLLFEMNVLFEAFVARTLRRAVRADGYTVHAQGGHLYCLTEIDREGKYVRPLFQTKPDILVKRGAEIILVIDTKWKRLAARIDDSKRGVSQADVYQMMAYGQIYRCPRLMLLYPHHAGLDEEEFTARHLVTASEHELAVATVDLAKFGSISTRLANLVRQAVECADPMALG